MIRTEAKPAITAAALTGWQRFDCVKAHVRLQTWISCYCY